METHTSGMAFSLLHFPWRNPQAASGSFHWQKEFWIKIVHNEILLKKSIRENICLCFYVSISYLYLKEEPLVKRIALDLGWGWSNKRKNEWYSTQIFQKILQWSRLTIINSSVSWWGPWTQTLREDIKSHSKPVSFTVDVESQTFRSNNRPLSVH